MKAIRIFFLYLAMGLLGILPQVQAQTAPSSAPISIFNHLTKVEAAKITIEADFTTLIANKKTNQYFPGTLTTEDGQTLKMELRPRGKYRRKISEIPPLKIKFSKKMLVAAGFDTLNEIKLVLPCTDNMESDELLVKEYLAYRMFEQLSPLSVKARLIKLTLRDSHVEKSKKTMFAMLVEDEEESSVRLKGTVVDSYGIPADSLLMNQAALVAVYNYMIGNTDWEIAMIRNVRLLKAPESGKVIVLPYDFDFSGFVSAPYASPSSDSGLKTVKDRFLMASGLKQDALKRATLLIQNNKEKLMNICNSRYLSRITINEVTEYLDTYFQQIAESDGVPSRFVMPMAD
ncbi:MAG: hypothetical protein NW218_15680 [Saprospiraceae bacterium]|nr:hypothetical protein [Saprospiraceae bacterium]